MIKQLHSILRRTMGVSAGRSQRGRSGRSSVNVSSNSLPELWRQPG
ncbi:MAG: hypothetical protein M3Y53_12875 [Thermoproteota archaeon]|nr:hypothetical protein [Thermoproteota archaeon]